MHAMTGDKGMGDTMGHCMMMGEESADRKEQHLSLTFCRPISDLSSLVHS